MDRLHFTNTATELQLDAAVNDSATLIQVTGGVAWGLSPDFTIIVNPDTSSEEVMRVTAVDSISMTVLRGIGDDGQAGTGAAFSHSAGATIRHAATAHDFNLIYDATIAVEDSLKKNQSTWGDIAPISAENPAP